MSDSINDKTRAIGGNNRGTSTAVSVLDGNLESQIQKQFSAKWTTDLFTIEKNNCEGFLLKVWIKGNDVYETSQVVGKCYIGDHTFQKANPLSYEKARDLILKHVTTNMLHRLKYNRGGQTENPYFTTEFSRDSNNRITEQPIFSFESNWKPTPADKYWTSKRAVTNSPGTITGRLPNSPHLQLISGNHAALKRRIAEIHRGNWIFGLLKAEQMNCDGFEINLTINMANYRGQDPQTAITDKFQTTGACRITPKGNNRWMSINEAAKMIDDFITPYIGRMGDYDATYTAVFKRDSSGKLTLRETTPKTLNVTSTPTQGALPVEREPTAQEVIADATEVSNDIRQGIIASVRELSHPSNALPAIAGIAAPFVIRKVAGMAKSVQAAEKAAKLVQRLKSKLKPIKLGDGGGKVDPKLLETVVNERVFNTGLRREDFQKNIAAMKIRLNGKEEYLTAANTPGLTHSEEHLLKQLQDLKGNNIEVLQLYSERIPCKGRCDEYLTALKRYHPKMEIYYTISGEGDRAQRLMKAYGL